MSVFHDQINVLSRINGLMQPDYTLVIELA